MGIALVEAMRAGLPIVATDIGGIPEVVVPECGVLVSDRNPVQMAEVAMGLMNDLAKLDHMSVAARARARNVFSAEAMENATDLVYRAMLGQTVTLPESVRADSHVSA
jgi:glycosyltransferase involved in cell wall biosynthesis